MRRLKYRNVTVSGLPGAGSSTLGRMLAKKLGWKYYCGGDFMRSYAIREGLFDGKSTFHHDATVYGDNFDRQVDFEVRRTAEEKDKNVMDAWLSGFMTLGITGILRVLVSCSEDTVRVDRIVNRDEVSVAKAKQHIFEREEKNLDKWARMYLNEWREWVVRTGKMPKEEPINFWDGRLYDLVIDTFSNSKEETLNKVLKELGV